MIKFGGPGDSESGRGRLRLRAEGRPVRPGTGKAVPGRAGQNPRSGPPGAVSPQWAGRASEAPDPEATR